MLVHQVLVRHLLWEVSANDLTDYLYYLLYLALDGKVVVLSLVSELRRQLLKQVNHLDDAWPLLEHWVVQLRN